MNSDRLTSGDDREAQDEGRGEPVVLVAFLEHGLQRRQADRHGGDAGPVAFLQQPELHRLPLQREIERASTMTAVGSTLTKKMVCQP